MSLQFILLTSLVMLVVWYVLRARESKELATRAVASYCQRLSLSMLDQTVALSKIAFKRDRNSPWFFINRWQLLREYRFDFTSTGEDRYQGRVWLSGKRVKNIEVPPHRIDD